MQYVQNRKIAAKRIRPRVPTVKMVPENVEKCTQVDIADLSLTLPLKKGGIPTHPPLKRKTPK
jgi:hypothetical protein